MSFIIPERLETERLILRTFEEKDWRDLYEYYRDEECMRYTVGRPLDQDESWRKMATIVGHWHLRGYGPYACVEKETSTVMGTVGLWFPYKWPEPEIKWGLARKFWRKGYAREAAAAVKAMADKHVPDIHLISLIYPQNTGSIRVAESIGASYEKTVPFRGKEAAIYRHLAPGSTR